MATSLLRIIISESRLIIFSLLVLIVLCLSPFIVVGLYLTHLNLQGLPHFAERLPSDYIGANLLYASRVRAAFPPGMSEAAVIRELGEDGFDVTAGKAVFARSGIPCRETWTITWHAKNGILESVEPSWTSTCL